MSRPRWYSQPFPPAGSISAEGIKRTLGRPPIPWPAILVREAAQNSWDARNDDSVVRFRISLSTVLPQHAGAWQRLLLDGAPPADKFRLRASLRGKGGGSTVVRTLTVSDRGTKGLGGPTRADTIRGNSPRDWVSFVLNVGDPPDTQHGGGTYGYGKGVLFRFSHAGAIIVHTRTAVSEGGPLQNRLIGICLGESVELIEPGGTLRPYTGRHWWGDVRETHVEPLIDDDAQRVATALGLPTFEENDTGTDVVIIDPDLGDDTEESAMAYLADSIAWNLWPIMLQIRGEERLVPEVYRNGDAVPVPVPEDTRGLKMFAAAYQRMRTGSEGVEVLRCGNPRRDLGRFVVEQNLATAYEPPPAAQDLGVLGSPHHVCLLRSPELVVKYHVGPEPTSAAVAYAAVFRSFDDLDRIYAAAEPPTHDDWVYAQMEGQERTFVRTTFTRIKERLAEFTRPAPIQAAGVKTPLGAASNLLGSLVAAAGGSGGGSGNGHVRPGAGSNGYGGAAAGSPQLSTSGPAGARTATGSVGPAESERPVDHGSGGIDGEATGQEGGPITVSVGRAGERRPRSWLQLRGAPDFSRDIGGPILVQRIFVRSEEAIIVDGIVSVTVADGTQEQDPPEHSDQPRVVGWRIAGSMIRTERLLLVPHPEGAEVEMLVRPARDTVTRIDARLEIADAD